MGSPYLEGAAVELLKAVTRVVSGEKKVEVAPRGFELKSGFTIKVN